MIVLMNPYEWEKWLKILIPVVYLLFEVPGRQDLDQQKDVDLSLFVKVVLK